MARVVSSKNRGRIVSGIGRRIFCSTLLMYWANTVPGFREYRVQVGGNFWIGFGERNRRSRIARSRKRISAKAPISGVAAILGQCLFGQDQRTESPACPSALVGGNSTTLINMA